jgi:GNAT superfamily N-acetyltransferase
VNSAAFAKALSFMSDLDERKATRIEDLEWGRALFHDPLPHVWDLNFIAIGRGSNVSPDEVARVAEEVQGRAGLTHRKVWVEDEAHGKAMAAHFEELRWEVVRLVTMVKQKEPELTVDTENVEEITWDEMRPLARAALQEYGFGKTPEVLAQLLAHSDVLREVADVHYYAMRVDGELASKSELYSDGNVAQVEDVMTLEAFRKRGLATQVVQKATEVASDEGHEVIFLVADLDEGPTSLYRKLGYENAGVCYTFTRKPPEGVST